ncbi:MAG: tRNA 2-thiocytidine biosynthesis protein TtcA [Clostridiales bacterium]|nr:tRNA 2-thiocytidine biosynthesis protein TtcA [Clostridiales bacterium]
MKDLTPAQKAEHSLNKKYRKTIWSKFTLAVKKYKLIESGDKIAVCISGGKDSMLLALLMKMFARFSEVPFTPVFLVMDPGYNKTNLQKIISNAQTLEIPLTVFNSNIFDVTATIDESPCYLCARMRRGYLYSKAKELGCNKIALGHHFSDVIETTVMGMFYGAQIQAMLPKLRSKNFEGMSLIRPLYCVHEDDIISWKNYNGLDFIRCACRFTEQNEGGDGDGTSKRLEIKNLIKELKKTNPNIEKSIFQSIHAVSLDTMVGYKQDGVEHSFLERYDKNGNADE